ncbi:MAG: response regulator transcription factor [Anaerolineae bacterium]
MDETSLQDAHVLVVDDDEHARDLITRILSRAGAQVSSAISGEEGLALLRAEPPDVILLDVMLPEMDGFEVCRRMLSEAQVPIILLTALSSEDETIRGFACGAVDYVTKPYSIKILLARVAAAVRRRSLSAEPVPMPPYDDGYLSVDLEQQRVSVEGEMVKLTPIEGRLLRCLVRNADGVVPLEDILLEVWGAEYHDSPNYVHVYISRLRSKLESHPQEHIYFHNERGSGYRFASR